MEEMRPKNPQSKPTPSPEPKRRPGALVEDETLAGTEEGGVKPKAPDGRIDEGATDRRENRNH